MNRPTLQLLLLLLLRNFQLGKQWVEGGKEKGEEGHGIGCTYYSCLYIQIIDTMLCTQRA